MPRGDFLLTNGSLETPGPGHYGKNLERRGRRHVKGSGFGRTTDARLYTPNNDGSLRHGVMIKNVETSGDGKNSPLFGRRSSNLLGHFQLSKSMNSLHFSTEEERAWMQNPTDANVLRKTPTFSDSKSQGPREWSTPGDHFSSRGGTQMVDSPGPMYDTSSHRQRPLSIPKDGRDRFLAKSPGPLAIRANGDYNHETGIGLSDRLLVYPSSKYHEQPGPAHYQIEERHVARNTSTRTAPKIVEHKTVPRQKKPHKLKPAFSKIGNLRADPAIVQDVLHQFEEYMQFSMLDIADTLKMYDADGSGALSAPELEAALSEMNIKVSSRQLLMLMAYLDKDGDMEVDLEELEHALQEFRKRNKTEHLYRQTYTLGSLNGHNVKSSYSSESLHMPTEIWETPELRQMRRNMWKRSKQGTSRQGRPTQGLGRSKQGRGESKQVTR